MEKVKAVALDEVQQLKCVLQNEVIDFYFTSIGDSVYNFELRYWIAFEKNTDYREAMSETIMHLKKRFEKENISIAYSVLSLDFGVKGGINLFDKSIQVATTTPQPPSN